MGFGLCLFFFLDGTGYMKRSILVREIDKNETFRCSDINYDQFQQTGAQLLVRDAQVPNKEEKVTTNITFLTLTRES